MKTTMRKRALKLSTGAVIAASLVACSASDKPSTSDAKQAFEAPLGLGDCQNIKISDFDRVNGIPQQDGSYVVQINYMVKIAPTDDIKNYLESKYQQELNDPSLGGPANVNNIVARQFIASIAHVCPHTPYLFIQHTLGTALSSPASPADFDHQVEVQVTNADLHMIKTDNGWQLAQ